MAKKKKTTHDIDSIPAQPGKDAASVCDCLVIDPCGCFIDPCNCFRTDEQGCYTDCGCPERTGEVLRKPLL